MRIKKNKYLNSIAVALVQPTELIERVILKLLFAYEGRLYDNYHPDQISSCMAFLLDWYTTADFMPEDAAHLLECLNNVELINE